MQISGIAIARGAMTGARSAHAIARLSNGMILICGGLDASGNPLATAEIYSPDTGQCVATGVMNVKRYGHTATVLTDGRVLVVGGQTTLSAYVGSAEYFYHHERTGRLGAFLSALIGLTTPRAGHAALLTTNGQLIVAGGSNGSGAIALTELYVPATAAEMIGVAPF
jgi:hypothetical protein